MLVRRAKLLVGLYRATIVYFAVPFIPGVVILGISFVINVMGTVMPELFGGMMGHGLFFLTLLSLSVVCSLYGLEVDRKRWHQNPSEPPPRLD